jgi:hypothetical protein
MEGLEALGGGASELCSINRAPPSGREPAAGRPITQEICDTNWGGIGRSVVPTVRTYV